MIEEAWKCFEQADLWALRLLACRHGTDRWTTAAANRLAWERKGLRLLALALGVKPAKGWLR
jgi:lambda repressor-like predicted transcriptional regulator